MNAVGGGGLTAVASLAATDGETAASAGARHDEHGLKVSLSMGEWDIPPNVATEADFAGLSHRA
jgi:hypothetical protein